MIFKGINHIAIIVSDMDVSKEFYINKLGFKVIDEIDRPERQSKICYLDAGNIIIELFTFPNSPNRLSRPESLGLRHIAFETDDFDGTLEKLKNLDIEVEHIRTDARTGKRLTFIKDPDDLPIEVSEV